MGRDQPSSDSGDPDLTFDRAMQMTAKSLMFEKTGTEACGLPLDACWMGQRPADALTAAVGHALEDTTDSQPQEPPKAKKPRKKAPAPPSPTQTDPAPSGSEDDSSAEEDATGRRKKASITQMLDEQQEEDLADWWREHLGLYDKSNETYRRKAKKDRLIADKTQEMGVRGFDAKMLAGWMKSMRTMYGKEEKKAKGKSGAAPPVLTSRQHWVVDTFKFL